MVYFLESHITQLGPVGKLCLSGHISMIGLYTYLPAYCEVEVASQGVVGGAGHVALCRLTHLYW